MKFEYKYTKYAVVLTFIITIIVNFLSNYLPLNNILTKEVSDLYPSLFTPISFTFSIWGLIYTLLLIYTIYQFIKFNDKKLSKLFTRIGILFSISNIINAIWIFCWHYDFIILANVLIGVMFIILLLINNELIHAQLSFKNYFIIKLPFTIYYGWLSIAFIAQTAVTLVKYGYTNVIFQESVWTIIILIVATIITSLIALSIKDLGYSFVIVWALSGILINHLNMDLYPNIILTTSVCIGFVIILILYNLKRILIKTK